MGKIVKLIHIIFEVTRSFFTFVITINYLHYITVLSRVILTAYYKIPHIGPAICGIFN